MVTDDEVEEIQPEKVKGHTSTDAQIRPVKRKSTQLELASSTQPSIRPFLFNGDIQPSNGDHQLSNDDNSSKVVCPLCFSHFTANEIAAHADECADRFDPVGIVSDDDDNDNDMENIIGISVLSDEPKNTSVDPTIEEIKEVISSKLCPNVNKDNTNRVSIRRKYAFQDYVDARKNPRRQFKENATLKVIFIGEPAVDDGGPRREFFTGIVH
jgi:hypothetical protein